MGIVNFVDHHIMTGGSNTPDYDGDGDVDANDAAEMFERRSDEEWERFLAGEGYSHAVLYCDFNSVSGVYDVVSDMLDALQGDYNGTSGGTGETALTAD